MPHIRRAHVVVPVMYAAPAGPAGTSCTRKAAR